MLNVLAWRALAGTARLRAGLGAALLLLLPWFWGLRVLDAAPSAAAEPVTVALVQGNIPGEMKWSGRHQREILGRFLSLSTEAAGDALFEAASGDALDIQEGANIETIAEERGKTVVVSNPFGAGGAISSYNFV